MIVKRFLICFIALEIFWGSFVFAEEKTLLFASGAGAMDAAVNIAISKGFFQENGINGKMELFKKGKFGFDQYISGHVDISLTGLSGIVLTDFDLQKHRIIGTLSYTNNRTKLLVRKSSGLIKPADLRGKKIATVKATTAHFYIEKVLALNSISKNEVEIVFMTKKQLPKAIADGEVDAICQHGMPIENAKKALRGDWVIFQNELIHRKPVLMVAPVAWLENNPEMVKNVFRSILKGEEFVQANMDESIRIMAEIKSYSLEAMKETMREEINYNLNLEQYLYMLLESMEQWAIDNNLVKRKIPRNYLELIDYRPLEAVAPERVSIIR